MKITKTALNSVGANIGGIEPVLAPFQISAHPLEAEDPRRHRIAVPVQVVQRFLNRRTEAPDPPNRRELSRVLGTVGDDLSIALAMLEAVDVLSASLMSKILAFSGLTDAAVLRIDPGLYAAAELAANTGRVFVGPHDAETMLAGIPQLQMILADNFAELVDKLQAFERHDMAPTTPPALSPAVPDSGDLAEIVHLRASPWAHTVRYVLELAAVGNLALALVGRPGSGRTMYARRLNSIRPPLTAEEACDVRRLYSAGGLHIDSRPTPRPFRAPHHTVSLSAVEGQVASARTGFQRRFIPGELSLAHRGVLFLDECHEFRTEVFDCVMNAYVNKVSSTKQAFSTQRSTAPANFQLIAAFNPCGCGYAGDLNWPCACTPTQLAQYRERMEERLRRFDVVLNLDKLPILATLPLAENFQSSQQVRERVTAVRSCFRPLIASRSVAHVITKVSGLSDLSAAATFDARQLAPMNFVW